MEGPHHSGNQSQHDSLPDENTLLANRKKHRDTIIKYLTPSHPTFYRLLSKYQLADDFTSRRDRPKMAEFLFTEIERRKDYHEFLKCLEEDRVSNEHLGHIHIASLLSGKRFSEEEAEESRSRKIETNS